MSASLNFDNTKGDTFNEVAFKLQINSIDVDLSDAVIKMQLKKSYKDSATILSLTSVASDGITITDGAAGEFKINEQIIDIPVHNYVYDIQITFEDNTVKTYIKGMFNILNEVTV